MGEYIYTPKNSIVQDLYFDLGMEVVGVDSIEDSMFVGSVYMNKVALERVDVAHHINKHYE